MANEPILNKGGKRFFYRFSVNERFQHFILVVCVIILAMTGFPVRHAEESWAKPLYDFMGGVEHAPVVHRITGIILLALFFYHTFYWIRLFYRNRIKRLKRDNQLTPKSAIIEFFSMDMMPNKKDARDFVQLWKYLLFFSNRRPQHERMSWREKFDYWAPYLGIPIIGMGGLALWFRDELSHFVPGIFLNAAYIMHTDEALLAVLFIFFVHWYNVHFAPDKFPSANVWITGYLSEEEMIREHYAEYVRVMTDQGLADEIKPANTDGGVVES